MSWTPIAQTSQFLLHICLKIVFMVTDWAGNFKVLVE